MKKVSLLVLSGALLMGSAMAANFYRVNNEVLRPQYQASGTTSQYLALHRSYTMSSRSSALQQIEQQAEQPAAAAHAAALANVAEHEQSPAEQQARRRAEQYDLEREDQ
ncbi:MAG: hypothetical protein CMF39_05875 [Legionellaceae bacterium]|nr:hypothetical protein [Legionellaceae bacterium]|tara:strand:+ start:591 stop:917 length:327 start_codon:yes stop_codon:yes gene_type:complete